MTKKWAPRNIQLVNTKKTWENDENDEKFDDFLNNFDDFSNSFKMQYECTGRKQNCIVYDSRKNKKDRTKGLF